MDIYQVTFAVKAFIKNDLHYMKDINLAGLHFHGKR